MKIIKRTRASARPKLLKGPRLQKGQTGAGTEYYYSKKPAQRRTDYVVAKANSAEAQVKIKTVRVTKK